MRLAGAAALFFGALEAVGSGVAAWCLLPADLSTPARVLLTLLTAAVGGLALGLVTALVVFVATQSAATRAAEDG